MASIHLYYDPISEFNRLFEDALASHVYNSMPLTAVCHTGARRHGSHRPRMDLHESEDTNTVTATFELPGLTSDDVAIDVHQNRLTVSGELIASESQEERSYSVRERHHGKFSRTLQLPYGTKSEHVKAKLEDGILTVTFPKASPEQQATRITIQ